MLLSKTNGDPYDLRGVSIDATAFCNLRCTMCSLDDFYADKGTMALKTFECLRTSLPKLEHIAFSSSAEPLLNEDLPTMLRIAKEETDGRINTSLTTNATLLDEAWSTALLDGGLDAMEFSLDGARKRTFEQIRVGADFGRVIDNIRAFVRRRDARGASRPHLSVRFTLNTDNVADLRRLASFVCGLGIEHLVVNGTEAYTPEMAARTLYRREGYPAVERRFRRLAEAADRRGMRLDLPRTAPEPIVDCDLINHSCIILWDGTVIPCSPLAYPRPFDFFGQRAHHERVSFGNILDTPLDAIWESADYRAFREDARAGRMREVCKTCLKRAGVICPLKHWNWLSTKNEPGAAPRSRLAEWRGALRLRTRLADIKRRVFRT